MNRRSLLKMLGAIPFAKAFVKEGEAAPAKPELPKDVDEELDLWSDNLARTCYMYGMPAFIYPQMSEEEKKSIDRIVDKHIHATKKRRSRR